MGHDTESTVDKYHRLPETLTRMLDTAQEILATVREIRDAVQGNGDTA